LAYNPLPQRYQGLRLKKKKLLGRNKIGIRADSINGDNFIDDGLSERPLNDY